jgi:hypothetical protein
MMLLNPLGATNVMVSRLGLGMAALGRPGYINLGHGEDVGAATLPASRAASTSRMRKPISKGHGQPDLHLGAPGSAHSGAHPRR